MADNRFYLIHEPSLHGVLIGKRLGGEIYPKNPDEVKMFFEWLSKFHCMTLDELYLFKEDTDEKYKYDVNIKPGLWKFKKVLKDG